MKKKKIRCEEKAAVRHATKQWMTLQARQLWEESILTKDQYEQERAKIMNRCVPVVGLEPLTKRKKTPKPGVLICVCVYVSSCNGTLSPTCDESKLVALLRAWMCLCSMCS